MAVSIELHPEVPHPSIWKQAKAGIARTGNGRYQDSVSLLVKAAGRNKTDGPQRRFRAQTWKPCAQNIRIKRNSIRVGGTEAVIGGPGVATAFPGAETAPKQCRLTETAEDVTRVTANGTQM
jgi:hypothetical protein